jgi:hypothetical protein
MPDIPALGCQPSLARLVFHSVHPLLSLNLNRIKLGANANFLVFKFSNFRVRQASLSLQQTNVYLFIKLTCNSTA